jgi:hypothetical protein
MKIPNSKFQTIRTIRKNKSKIQNKEKSAAMLLGKVVTTQRRLWSQPAGLNENKQV